MSCHCRASNKYILLVVVVVVVFVVVSFAANVVYMELIFVMASMAKRGGTCAHLRLTGARARVRSHEYLAMDTHTPLLAVNGFDEPNKRHH